MQKELPQLAGGNLSSQGLTIYSFSLFKLAQGIQNSNTVMLKSEVVQTLDICNLS